jgi:hypothetical protein
MVENVFNDKIKKSWRKVYLMHKILNYSRVVLAACMLFLAWSYGFSYGVTRATNNLTKDYLNRVAQVSLQQQEVCLKDFMVLGMEYADTLEVVLTKTCPDLSKEIRESKKALPEVHYSSLVRK